MYDSLASPNNCRFHVRQAVTKSKIDLQHGYFWTRSRVVIDTVPLHSVQGRQHAQGGRDVA